MRPAPAFGTFLLVLVGLRADAQSPKHIEVPDPLEEVAPEPAPAEPAPEPAPAEPAPAPTGGGAPRRGDREVKGVPPTALAGRYEVVQITEAGTTEDFRIKMDRAGRALNQDCITVGLIFDFGAGGATLPNRLRILERQECYKGGLGRYANELAIEVPVAWSKAENSAILTVPEVKATSSLVRLRKPEPGDLRTPPQWLGPETEVERARSDYKVLVELPRRGKGEGPPEAIHLALDNVVLHLEPKQPGGAFQD